MPNKHILKRSLTSELPGFIRARAGSDRFGPSSEIIRAALRGLEGKTSRSQRASGLGLAKRPIPGAETYGSATNLWSARP
jgi:Arc/MetJ-type ribon-helix-helix transcriptional regulator